MPTRIPSRLNPPIHDQESARRFFLGESSYKGKSRDKNPQAARDFNGRPKDPHPELNREPDPFKKWWSDRGADDIRSDRDYPGRFQHPRDPREMPRGKGPMNPAVRQLAQQIAGLMEQTKVGKWVREQINKSHMHDPLSPEGGADTPLHQLQLDDEEVPEGMTSEDWNSHWDEPVRTGAR
jgi:hypothetical protein